MHRAVVGISVVRRWSRRITLARFGRKLTERVVQDCGEVQRVGEQVRVPNRLPHNVFWIASQASDLLAAEEPLARRRRQWAVLANPVVEDLGLPMPERKSDTPTGFTRAFTGCTRTAMMGG